MIEARSVSFRYHEDWVLRDVSFQIEKGEFIGIIGPTAPEDNPAEASLQTSLPQEGELLHDHIPLRKMKRAEIARKVAVVAQETHLLFPSQHWKLS